jgi:hypothetical protein
MNARRKYTGKNTTVTRHFEKRWPNPTSYER